MTRHLDREVGRLKKMILALCAVVEESVQHAVGAVQSCDEALATRVIDSDVVIDQMEVDVEEECLKTFALYQPVAIDLRFVVAVLKINNDLERIGDEAVNIAERALFFARHEPIDNARFDFELMAAKTQTMLRMSLDALMRAETAPANEVCRADDEVDDLHRQMFVRIQQAIQQEPERVEYYIHLLSISRHLERIADYATNIAEDVIYMINGEIIRHKAEAFQ
jgi:phosphate transport system protein